MGRFFSADAPLFRFLRQIMILVLRNVAFLICALPVFTIGAASAALVGVTLEEPDDDTPLRTYFSRFRRDFLAATKAWLLVLVWSAVIFFDYLLTRTNPTGTMTMMSMIMLLAGYFLTMVCSWLFPLVALTENTTKGYYLEAFRLALTFLPSSVWMAALNLLPLVLTVLYPFQVFKFGYVVVLIAFSGIVRFNAMALARVLAPQIHPNLPEVTED